MTVFKKQLLPVALLCNVLAAQASDVQMGDFWVVHYQGGLGNNQVFVADGDPNNIFDRPGGAKSLGVYQYFLCKPADRQARKMERLGVMPASQIAKAGPQLFERDPAETNHR
ncbi:hypothetical protein N5C37_14485 [Pseudomonas mosselii]|uniref:hypothetical protein n=1 Tax=Pseudomonas mosselii TaxID=78327 RepID=UPI002449392E|nr:hypothetical protein [Pseudomonas mosselii]MDH1102323.1 hypothetical protein [Pseudomonas mosselii]